MREHDEKLNQIERTRNITDTKVFYFNDEVFAEMMKKNDAWNMETARIRFVSYFFILTISYLQLSTVIYSQEKICSGTSWDIVTDGQFVSHLM